MASHTNRKNSTSVHVEGAGTAHPTGTTRLKLWAFRTLKNTTSNILSEIFTHSFSRVEPLLARQDVYLQICVLDGGLVVSLE